MGDRAREAWLEGTEAFRSDDYERAVDCFSRALIFKPDDPRLLGNRSSALLALGKGEESLSDADQCVLLSPNWAKGHIKRALALRFLGRHSEALRALDTADRLDPHNLTVATLRKYAVAPRHPPPTSCTESEELFLSALSKVDSPRSASPAGSTLHRSPSPEYYSRLAKNAAATPPPSLPPPPLPTEDPLPDTSQPPSGGYLVRAADGTTFTTYFSAPSLSSRRDGSTAFSPPNPPSVPHVASSRYNPPDSPELHASASRRSLMDRARDTAPPPAPPPPLPPSTPPPPSLTWMRILLAMAAAGVGWVGTTLCRSPLTTAWIIAISVCSIWSITLTTAIPQLPTDARPQGGSFFGGTVAAVVVGAAAVAGGIMAGPRGVMGIGEALRVQKCPLLLIVLAGFHALSTAHAAEALRGCSLVPGGLDLQARNRLSRRLTPGLLLYVALAAGAVFHWCSAVKVVPTSSAMMLLPASASLLLSAGSLGGLGSGLWHADAAVRVAEGLPAVYPVIRPLGLTPREWVWFTVVCSLVTTYFALQGKEQDCPCTDVPRKWTIFGF